MHEADDIVFNPNLPPEALEALHAPRLDVRTLSLKDLFALATGSGIALDLGFGDDARALMKGAILPLEVAPLTVTRLNTGPDKLTTMSLHDLSNLAASKGFRWDLRIQPSKPGKVMLTLHPAEERRKKTPLEYSWWLVTALIPAAVVNLSFAPMAVAAVAAVTAMLATRASRKVKPWSVNWLTSVLAYSVAALLAGEMLSLLAGCPAAVCR